MIVDEIIFQMKDGRTAALRSPGEDAAADMLEFITAAAGETEFLLRYPEEFADFSVEREREWIRHCRADPNIALLACYVNGRLAGNCQIAFHTGLKHRHRAEVAIALRKEFWGLGIGTEMFAELIRLAEARPGVRQIELEFIEGNRRARGLYEKMGFRITGVRPDAIRRKDGTFLNAYMMTKRL